MYFIAVIAALLVALVAWFITAGVVAHSIIRIEERYPRLAGSRSLRAGEIIACGAVVLACFAAAFWVALVMLEK